MKRTFTISSMLLAALLLSYGRVAAHGGEDHGTAAPEPVSIAGAMVDQLTTFGTSKQFEILLKYAPPEVDAPASLRFFIADYATNRPVSGASFVLASKPSGVTAKSPPRMVAPGIYDVVVTFPRDTIYDLSATVAAEGRSDRISVGHVYAGDAAEQFLAEHAPAGAAEMEESGRAWWVWGLAGLGVVAVAVAVVLWRGKGKRRGPTKGEAVVLILCAAIAVMRTLFAHGGEEHGDPAPAPASSTSGMLTIAKEQQFALEMLTEETAMRDMAKSIDVTGRIVPRTEAVAEVVAPVGGRVVGGALPRLGERVRRGQVLFRVAQVLAPSERGALRTEQIRAKAELDAAEREVSRFERLEGVVAGKQIVEARIRRDAARATYNAISEQLSSGGGSVAVTAPINGTITMAEIAEGEVLDGSKVVYRIADLSRVWVEADLFEGDVARIEGASQAEIRTTAYPGEIFHGTLYRLGGDVDPESRTIRALFIVDNPNERLKLNMSASIAVTVAKASNILAVPRDAVVRSGGRTLLFVHTAPEQFETRDVVLGSGSGGNYVEIVSGIRAGERVLVTGTYQLKAEGGL